MTIVIFEETRPQKTWKHQYMAENVITPGTPKEGVRRSKRTRFKSHWVTGQVNTVTHVMLTDQMIKNGDFGFGQFHLNHPANIGKEAAKNVLNLKSAKDRDPSAKKGRPKKSKKLNDTAADFKALSDDGKIFCVLFQLCNMKRLDDLEHYVDLLTKDIEIPKGDSTGPVHNQFINYLQDGPCEEHIIYYTCDNFL